MKRPLALGAAFAAGLTAVGLAVAGLNGNWSTHLQGRYELPVPIDTNTQGQAHFRLAKDGGSIAYKLIASNIENAFQAHIHLRANAGAATGGIVVWLYPSTAPVPGPLGAGRHDGVLAEGTITAADLRGALAGQPLGALVAALDGGLAYVNVHTNDGVAPVTNTAGDVPAGEIRGDLP